MYRWIYYEKISVVRLIVYNFKKNTICWLHSVFRQKIPVPRKFQVSNAVKILRFRYRKYPRLSSRQKLHAQFHRFPDKRKKAPPVFLRQEPFLKPNTETFFHVFDRYSYAFFLCVFLYVFEFLRDLN